MTVEIDQARLAKIKTIRANSHALPPEEDCGDPEMCAMEARNWVRHLKWTDQEQSGDLPPDIASLVRALNDRERDDAKRTRRMMEIVLMPSVPIGSLALRRKRAWAIVDWDVRWRQPRLLRAIGLADEAVRLEALPEIVDADGARDAKKVSDEINTSVRAKRDAAIGELKKKGLDALDARAALDDLDARAALAALAALDDLDALAARAALDDLDARAARDALDARAALAALDARGPEAFAKAWEKIYNAARTGGYWAAREVADEVLGPEFRAKQAERYGTLVDEVNDGTLDLIKRLAAMQEPKS